uniref:Capsid protein n=1 Tax=viral metagenome TaxID=1070528 RepID=A0A6M3XD21_9ZZZZ
MAWSLDRVMRNFEIEVENELQDFAEDVEDHAKNRRQWNDDTGSAAQSVTGWVVDRGDRTKNWGGGKWEHARTTSGVSRWGHNMDNYEITEMNEPSIGQHDETTVALTTFMKYGPAMKTHWTHGAQTMIETIKESSHWGEAPFLMACARAVRSAIS